MSIILSARTGKLLPYILVLIVLIVWAILQYFLYQRHGISIPADATVRYIPHAKKIAFEGYLDFGYDIRYVGYTILLAIALKTGLSFLYVVYLQILLSLLAVIMVYKTSYVLSKNHFLAFIAALLLASSQDIQQWNYYILTESVFTSTFIACFYVLVQCKGRQCLLFIPLALYACLVRPNGFIIVASLFVYLFSSIYIKSDRKRKRNLELCLLVVAALLLLLANQLLSPFTIVETYAKGEIIYASSFYRIPPPANLQMPRSEAFALQKIVLFFCHNPEFALKQFFTKGLVFLAFIKPYFSFSHKLLIALTIYPCYLLITRAFIRPSSRPYTFFMLSMVFLQTLIVMFTSEDWDCRFIVPILPFIFLLAMLGLKNLLQKHTNVLPVLEPSSLEKEEIIS